MIPLTLDNKSFHPYCRFNCEPSLIGKSCSFLTRQSDEKARGPTVNGCVVFLSLQQVMNNVTTNKGASSAEAKLCRNAFDLFDQDKSGFIDAKELQQLAYSLG